MIYDMFHDRIYKYVYFKVGNREDAEDIAQNTFVGTLKNINNFYWRTTEYESDFTAWIFSIAHNGIVDHFRKKSRQNIKPFEDLDLVEEKIGPADFAEKASEIEKLKNAIGKINCSQRDILVLRYINGMSIKQTATIMDKTEGAIKSLQLRALESLKKLFVEDLSEDLSANLKQVFK